MADMTTEVLQQIRADIREMRDGLNDRIDALDTRVDGLEARVGTMDYTLRGMSADLQHIPEVLRLLRQVADLAADHDVRIERLER